MRQLSIGFEFRLESQINKLQLFLLTFSRNCLRSVLAKQMAVYKTGTPSQNQTKNKIVNMCTFYFFHLMRMNISEILKTGRVERSC